MPNFLCYRLHQLQHQHLLRVQLQQHHRKSNPKKPMWADAGQTGSEAVLEDVAAAALSAVVRHGVAELAGATTGMQNALLGMGRLEACNRVASRQSRHGARPRALLVPGVHHPLGVVVHRRMLAMVCRDLRDHLALANSHHHHRGVADGDQAHLRSIGVGPMP